MSFDTRIILQYWPILLHGLLMTLIIVCLAFFGGLLIGLLVCSATMGKSRLVVLAGRLYVNCFRNIPDIVLIFWAYFCLPSILGWNIPALTSGIVALTLASAANLAEIFRAGINSIPHGQPEAAASLGLRRWLIWTKILIPQAVRRVIGPVINYLAELLKNSTLLSAIGVSEAAHVAFSLGSQTYRFLEFFSIIGAAFFCIIFPLSVIARKFARQEATKL